MELPDMRSSYREVFYDVIVFANIELKHRIW